MKNGCPSVGLLFMGNEHDEIWGSAITTYYLGEALQTQGCAVRRTSAGDASGVKALLSNPPDLVVSEGVPANMIPEPLWREGTTVVFWALSSLFYSDETIRATPFQGVATNSSKVLEHLARHRLPGAKIDLAAPSTFASALPDHAYRTPCAYLGCYPHKTMAQMELLFGPASRHGLALYGYGWDGSPFRAWDRGPLPLGDIARLYASTEVVLGISPRIKSRAEGEKEW